MIVLQKEPLQIMTAGENGMIRLFEIALWRRVLFVKICYFSVFEFQILSYFFLVEHSCLLWQLLMKFWFLKFIYFFFIFIIFKTVWIGLDIWIIFNVLYFWFIWWFLDPRKWRTMWCTGTRRSATRCRKRSTISFMTVSVQFIS